MHLFFSFAFFLILSSFRPFEKILNRLLDIFANYLYTGCLDEVQDARDLLTGFVYTLRDITAKELREELTPGASDPNQWNEVLLTRYVVAVVTRIEEGEGVKKTYYEFIRRRGRMTCQLLGSVRPEEKSIEFTTPTKFLCKEFSGSEGGLVLEPINLNDHGRILLRFPDRFAPYFGCLGDLNLEETDAGKELDSDLAFLADIRNKIAHYSRRGLTHEMEQTPIRLCRKYLKSIYTYISTGKRAEADSVGGPSPECVCQRKSSAKGLEKVKQHQHKINGNRDRPEGPLGSPDAQHLEPFFRCGYRVKSTYPKMSEEAPAKRA